MSAVLSGPSDHPWVLRAEGLSRSYRVPGAASAPGTRGGGVQLFRDLDLEIGRGEMVAIVGRSGTGKSSLLHLLAGLDRPTAGDVWVGGQRLRDMSSSALAMLRNQLIGFVWQFHYLLPEFTALENVALPLLARGTARRAALEQARGWLGRVELGQRADHRSGELSGGEQQRIALARALVTTPTILFADEPTGDLDDETAAHLFTLIRRLCLEEQQLSVLLVTHNLEIAAQCDRTLRLAEGRLAPAQPV